jgi:F-type H+-transporting ATPase subunit b
MALLYDTYLMVAVSFFLFFGLLYRYGVHRMVLAALDARAERIRAELDEAKRLREEAQTLLASYERKQKDVEAQAEAIVARAREDAEMAAKQAQLDLTAAVDRRMRAAADQLAAAEAAAMRAVKDEAVRVAVEAAAALIARSVTPQQSRERIDAAIAEIGRRLN